MSEPEPFAAETGESPVPVEIQRDQEDGIVIRWSDGLVVRRTASQLRKACPCATCREKKRGESKLKQGESSFRALPILSKAEAQPLRVLSMQPVGAYAYQIAFSDGHSSGIYPFSLLRKIPDSVDSQDEEQ